jgi:GNAT superfamily N-acetyltransferase
VKIELQAQSPSEGKFQALFKVTGRNREVHAEPEELARGLDNRQVVVAAYEGDRLVGVGRVAADGLLRGWVYDMIVDPKFRGLGIGTQVLQALVGWCEERHIGEIRVFPTRSSRGFFERNGFAARPDGAPGLQYSRELERLSRVTRSQKIQEGRQSTWIVG